jgi:hypothetical protein
MNGTVEIEMHDIEIQMDDVVSKADPPASMPASVPASPDHEQPMTLYFAPQVERSFVSTLWHAPQYLDLARHELDFELHISIPPYRKILQALIVVYGDLGLDLDWICVVQCILELGAMEECGGLPGLDEVFTDCGHYPEGRSLPEPTVGEYIRLLKLYAIARGADPYTPVKHYTRGRGFLQKNKLATTPAHPCVIGKIERCCCGKRCTIAGWPGEEGINLVLNLER